MEDFVLRADDEIFLEAGLVHSRSVVADFDAVWLDRDPDLRGVGVVSVVDQLAQQLDALGVEALADGHDVALVDDDLERFPVLDVHGRLRR